MSVFTQKEALSIGKLVGAAYKDQGFEILKIQIDDYKFGNALGLKIIFKNGEELNIPDEIYTQASADRVKIMQYVDGQMTEIIKRKTQYERNKNQE